MRRKKAEESAAQKLFFGGLLSLEQRNLLDQVPEDVQRVFLGGADIQLQLLLWKGDLYLGRFCRSGTLVSELIAIEQNIRSIVLRLSPELLPEEEPLVLFSCN